MKISFKNRETHGYPMTKPRDPTTISFDTLPACDGQTDGQTDTPHRCRVVA